MLLFRTFVPLLLLFALPLRAQAEAVTIKTQGGPVVIAQEQQLMLDAAQKVLKSDWRGALAVYDQVIALNASSIQGHLQRSVVKRELQDARGSQQDAAMAVTLSEAALQQNPQSARLYYQRGTGYRLLKDFPKATENIRYAMQMKGGKRNWETDLKAIALEEKMSQ
jgi:tetratricopeptide (TPR) repeat protein